MKHFELIYKIFRYKLWFYIVNVIVWLLVESVHLIPPLIIREILNSFTNSNLSDNYWLLIFLIVLSYITRIIFTYMGIAVGASYGFTIRTYLRNNLLKGILNYPGKEALKVSPSEALNRFKDDTQQVQEMVDWPIDVFVKLVPAVIAVIILININAKMTLVIIIPLYIVLSIAQNLKKKAYKYREASREATSEVVSAMGEMFASIQAIQVANAEDSVIEHLHELNNKRHSTMLKDTLFMKILDSLLDNIMHIGTGLILFMSAHALKNGNFTVGDFALFISYWLIVTDFTANFGSLINAYHQGKVSLKRLVELLHKSKPTELVKYEPVNLIGKLPAEKNNKSTLEKLDKLEVSGLSYNYTDQKTGINDMNFRIQKGTFTVIVGRVGSGKSTLLNCLLGQLPISTGTVKWNGKIISDLNKQLVPPRCAYTSQVPHLFSDTVLNNITLGTNDTVNLDKAINLAVLEQDLEELEHGLDTMIGPRGVKLSGGQIQRVAAARMYATNSDLYVFDDISSALDVNTEKALWNRLGNTDFTCIAVSNRKEAIDKANQIIVLKDGSIESIGKINDLLANSEEFRSIYQK